MDYKLAKELKDAGFPNIDFCSMQSTCIDPYCHDVPTLSELIEAVPNFIALRDETGFWGASGWKVNRKDWIQKDGKTPEEAVARLWLELNKENI